MDPTTDNMNCGACGFMCTGALTCELVIDTYTVCGCTQTSQCGQGATGCDAVGQCECSGQKCSGNEVCVNALCSCPANGGADCGLSNACCSDGCKNLGQDPNNCGACGHKCGGANPHCVGAQCQ